MHDKELLSNKYASVKFRVQLSGTESFVAFTYHASLLNAIKSLRLSPRMAVWLAFFSEFNFRVEYKPGNSNVLADALSRSPDFEDRYLGDVACAKALVVSSTVADLRVDHMTNTLNSKIKER